MLSYTYYIQCNDNVNIPRLLIDKPKIKSNFKAGTSTENIPIKLDNKLDREAALFRMLHLLTSSGVPFGTALEIAADSFVDYKATLVAMSRNFNDGTDTQTVFFHESKHFSNFIPYVFHEVEDTEQFAASTGKVAHILSRANYLLKRGVIIRTVEEINFYRVLGALLQSSNAILVSLEEAGKEYLGYNETQKLTDAIRNGNCLVDGMRGIPSNFSERDMVFVTIGEQCGNLSQCCEKLAVLKELFALEGKLNAVPSTEYPNLLVSEEVLFDYHCLASWLWAGLPVVRALVAVAGITKDGNRQHALLGIIEDIRNGSSFGEAMEKHPKEFPRFVTELVTQGENRGELDQTFQRLTNYFHWELFGVPPTYSSAVALTT